MKAILRLFILGTLALSGCDTTPKLECQANNECTQPKQACKNNKCTDVACTQDSHCPSGGTCSIDNTCKTPPGCPFLPDGCCEDTDCKQGESCVADKCQVKSLPCSQDDDCKDTSKPRCVDATCQEDGKCSSNEHCKDPSKPECKDGACIASTKAKLGEECDKMPCESDLLCYANVGTPFCRQPCDPFNAICKGGSVCALIATDKGACVPRNNGKVDGEACVSQSCERNFFCIDWTEKICARPCRPDKKDCSDQEVCYDFGSLHLCVPTPPQCGPGRPCTDNWKCDEKQSICQPPKCPTIPCKDSEICKLGACETRNCCKGDPCGKDTVCHHQNGQCVALEITVPFCNSCLGDGTCASKADRCITLTGTDDKLCAEECTATKQCTDTQMECIEQSDKRFFCIPRAKTCLRDRCDNVTCPTGESCLPSTKACVKIGLALCQPCSDDLQCGGPTDKCIKEKDAKEGHCGVDCSGCTTCPTDYSCKDMGTSKQCIPNSGKCL